MDEQSSTNPNLNQPNNEVSGLSSESISGPEPISDAEPNSFPDQAATVIVDETISTGSVPTKPKKKRGPLIAILTISILLIAGIATFATFSIIKNQPDNIVMSAIGNLLSAERLELDGEISYTINTESMYDDYSFSADYTAPELASSLYPSMFTLKFNEQAEGQNAAATANLVVDFTNETQVSVNLGEVFLQNGTLYFEVDGLKEAYESVLAPQIKETLTQQLNSNYQYGLVSECYSSPDTSYEECLELYDVEPDPAIISTSEAYLDNVLNQFGTIIDSVDGQWLEISIEDIVNSDLFSSITQSERQKIIDSYNCTTDTLGQMSKYSSELSNLYSQNPFLKMTSAQDGFYDISFDTSNLASYINALPRTQVVNDIASCYDYKITDDVESGIASNNLSSSLENLPRISAKFDGFFNHHLTEVKLNQQSDYYQLAADLKIAYPSSVSISAPSDTRPLIEVIEEVYQQILEIEGIRPKGVL